MRVAACLPHRLIVQDWNRGTGRAAKIRELYAQGCNVIEICLALGVSRPEVIRHVRKEIPWDRGGELGRHRGPSGVYSTTRKEVLSVNEREPSTQERINGLRARFGQHVDPFSGRMVRDHRRCCRAMDPGDPNHGFGASGSGSDRRFHPVLSGFVPHYTEASQSKSLINLERDHGA